MTSAPRLSLCAALLGFKHRLHGRSYHVCRGHSVIDGEALKPLAQFNYAAASVFNKWSAIISRPSAPPLRLMTNPKMPGLHDESLAEIIRAAFPEVVAEDEKKDSEEEKKVEDKEETSA